MRSDLRSRCAARLLAALCLAGSTTAALAQTVEAPALGNEGETRVLPVWSHSSGRIEALLLLDPVDTSLSGNALDRVLNPGKPSLGLGARLQLGDNNQLQAALQLESDGIALLCDDSHGLSQALGALGEHCLLATLGAEDPLLAASSQGARAGVDWNLSGTNVDLSFGLSWLRAETEAPWQSAPVSALHRLGLGSNSLDLIGAWAQRLDSQHLRMTGLVDLGPQARLLLGGDIGRNRLQTRLGNDLEWDSAALSLGLGYGDFSGLLTGRLIEVPQGGAPWRSLDIGVSWRTPWRGQLSVGARNVLGDSDTSRWPLAELPSIEDPSARVPYVRYQQDL